jgi:acyl-CoA thioesterase FadM
MHIHYLHEIRATDELQITSSILDFDRKRIHAACTFTCPRLSETAATADMMLLHVRQGEKPAAAAFPDLVIAALGALKLSEAAREAFGPGSRKIELKRR